MAVPPPRGPLPGRRRGSLQAERERLRKGKDPGAPLAGAGERWLPRSLPTLLRVLRGAPPRGHAKAWRGIPRAPRCPSHCPQLRNKGGRWDLQGGVRQGGAAVVASLKPGCGRGAHSFREAGAARRASPRASASVPRPGWRRPPTRGPVAAALYGPAWGCLAGRGTRRSYAR